MMKNAVGSNLSLVGSSSIDSLTNAGAVADQMRVKDPISPIIEERGNDESELAFRVGTSVERKLDDLNQTKTLMSRIEKEGNKIAKFRKYASVTTVSDVGRGDTEDDYHQDRYEDTKDDKKHLVQFKNLPSIRDRLLSIKTKQ